MALSRERIADELRKLLVAPGAVGVLRLMVARGILLPVLPEIESAGIDRMASLADREAAAGIAPHAIRRLAAVLPADRGINESVGARLKLSNAERKRLASAIEGTGSEGVRALGYRIGIDAANDRLLVSGNDTAPLAGWRPPSLPITGGMLVERGIQRGPEVARLLRAVETRWIAEGFADAARTEAIADELVGQALSEDSNRNA
jgi:poly(A) polymerase